MLKGTVKYAVKIGPPGLVFPEIDLSSNEPGVAHIQLECEDGKSCCATVHLVNVATPDDGMAIANKVTNNVLDRLSFLYKSPSSPIRMLDNHFFESDAPTSLRAVIHGHSSFTAEMSFALQPDRLKLELERVDPPGARHFGLFRSALRSASPVEAFMHIYNLLLMLLKDHQATVDAFICKLEPAVPQTQSPKNKGKETIYTRLRNEFAHQRPGVAIEETKREMALRLPGLMELTKKAIELNP